jgi:predicted esterase
MRGLFSGLLIFVAGCQGYKHLDLPSQVQKIVEPSLGAEYLLYVPSTYDPEYSWPLVITCHGTPPFDRPDREMGDWAPVAESEQFIIVCPTLEGTKSVFPPEAPEQIQLQHADERRLLATLQHIRGAYNISEDRVFLTGWSAGAYAVLHTGIRHSDVFRALAVIQGNFNPVYFAALTDSIEYHQPILVLYSMSDLIAGEESKAMIQWLNEHGAYVIEEETAGGHQNHPKNAQSFFERVVRHVPHMQVRAYSAGGGMNVRFKTQSSIPAVRYDWDFGDGSRANVPEPEHSYSQAGSYTVQVRLTAESGKTMTRSFEITVPIQRDGALMTVPPNGST